MAKKSRVYIVQVRTAQEGVFWYQKPVPGMSKKHVFDEINDNTIAVLDIRYTGWYELTLSASNPSDYYFELTSKKTGNVYVYEPGDFGWKHLEYQFHTAIEDMTDYMDSDY